MGSKSYFLKQPNCSAIVRVRMRRMRHEIIVLLVALVFCGGAVGNDEACSAPLLGASTSGLLDTVGAMQNTLGYAGLDSIQARKAMETEGDACRIKFASIINKKGAVVKPSSDGAQAAVRSNSQAFLESTCPGFGLCAEIYDGKDADVWPMSTLTYLIVPTNTTDAEEGCDRMKTLYDYVKWILTDEAASNIAKDLSMATMPKVVAEQAQLILDEMKCYDRTLGWHLVKDRRSRAGTLSGSGSSLQAALQTRLTNEYFQQNFISISYTSSSSGTGRAALREREFDFAGSDSILDMSDPEFIRRGLRMVPAFAAAVGVIFNIDQVEQLVLSRRALDRMFTGEISSWRDPEILATNDAVAGLLPDQAILRVVRESKSGTTSALTKALYAFAEHPTGPSLDYSLHVLGGSGLPVWPAHPQPYAGATTCKFQECISAVCELGHFLDAQLGRCHECLMGTFSDLRGQHTECQPCPPGAYSNTVGNSKCFKCSDQKFQNEGGQSSCKNCPANTRRFSVEVEQPNGAITKEPSPGVAIQECRCVAGYWLPGSETNASLGGLECEQCPDGASCGGHPQTIPQSKTGFWGDRAHPHVFFECQVDSCLKDYECVEGHQGRMCAQPTKGFFTIGELWFLECPAEGYRAVFTVGCVLLAVVVWTLIHHLSLSSDAFAIAFLFFQNIGLISNFRLRWHPNLNLVLIALRIINFDVDFVGPQCMLPSWNAATAYFVQLLLPGIVVAWCTAYVYFLRFLRRRRGVSMASSSAVIENKAFLRSVSYEAEDLQTYLGVKGLSYFIMMFHTLAFRAFSVFVCEEDSGGEHAYMVTAPTVQCWHGVHVAMVVCSVLLIPTMVLGIPLLLLWRLLRIKRDDKLCDASVAISFGFVYAKFEAGYPYWELVLLARRFVLVLLVVFVRVSMLQAALAIAALNVFLCLHLTHNPFKDKRVGLLDSFGACCSMAYAVCGMLFYPSLDYTLECVGSSNLEELGEQCRGNQQLKHETSVVLLLLLFATFAAALYIFYKDMQAKLHSAAAAKRIEADRQWYGKDKMSKLIRTMPRSSRSARFASVLGSLGIDPSSAAACDRTPSVSSDSRSLTKSITDAVEAEAAFQSLREVCEEVKGREFAKPERLNLCDMLVGDSLQNWHKSLSTLSDTELAVRLLFSDQGESESIRQEMAYMDLEMWLPAFAVRHELIDGFYSDGGLARILRALITALPELIDWLATVEDETVQALSNFVNAYAIFVQKNSRSALHRLVVPTQKGQVVHWLAQCSVVEQRAFRTIFSAMSEAGGHTTGLSSLLRRLPSRSSKKVADAGQTESTTSGSDEAMVVIPAAIASSNVVLPSQTSSESIDSSEGRRESTCIVVGAENA